MVTHPMRVAVFGGDKRRERHGDRCCVYFQSPRDGGNGELRRLEAAIRSGMITRVLILARWNGHAATRRLRRVCRTCGVPVSVVP